MSLSRTSALACAVLLLAGTAVRAEPRTFIGAVEGGPESARIALVADESAVTAYVCSGDDEFNQKFSEWFTGEVEDGLVSLESDQVKLVARMTGKVMDGRIKFEDKSLKFKAEALPENSVAGLFRAEVPLEEGEGQIVCGWIIAPEGSCVGALQVLKKAGKKIVKAVGTLALNRVKEVATKVKNVAGAVKDVAGAVEDVAGLIAGDAAPAVAKAGAAKGSKIQPKRLSAALKRAKPVK